MNLFCCGLLLCGCCVMVWCLLRFTVCFSCCDTCLWGYVGFGLVCRVGVAFVGCLLGNLWVFLGVLFC